MSDSTTIRLEMVAHRSERNVGRLYIEARVAGVEVSHYPELLCCDFEGAPVAGCQLGLFRSIGAVVFYKDERRWEVRARTDCGEVEMATLIALGLELNQRLGRTPGQYTRKREFTHCTSTRTEKRVAWARVAYKLTAEDILQAESASAAIDLQAIEASLQKSDS